MTWRTAIRISSLPLLIAALGASASASSNAIEVKIVEKNGTYQLLRGGKPYHIKGAGIDHSDLTQLAAHGGNSFRTWAVDDGPIPAQQLLDRAHQLGLTVSLCLEFARERHGFDYDDPQAVARQFEETKARVLKYKDHPALLTWIIGNELNYGFKNPKVYDAVNDVAAMIKQIDPNHPVTTALAAFDHKALAVISERAPNLDFVSFQSYGSLYDLPKEVEKTNFSQPYFVTEWGSIGHWEVGKTEWGAPIEQTSSEKAENYKKSYETILEPQAHQAIGNYVFLWGQKQEKTPTWYGMFLDSGEKTEAVDVMHYIWNHRWPDNRAPKVSPIKLNEKTAPENVKLRSGMEYTAKIDVDDPDNDKLTYKWEIRYESTATQEGGDREEIPAVINGLISAPSKQQVKLVAPTQPGAYRLFAYIYDGHNNAAHANIPFYVK
ncbi:hypothetical protein HBA55_24365 [Pseudomaricurvus alkylphenolicus]|uniref:glycoside hydrolase family 2 TIM barrel-domain containing protein n=1 Tax=Pseudomaricurvus alkylphenolicus TaxID=1306991 RepID=UPI001421FB6A|nr:glycoside hydrolase family 2 TIM barrel-domain containing protein [Pseudomaricurvus alkylphenolicus]NIB42764.1 hypothetical protein [Pseudomaricurvus alkylphenolicus]